MPAGWAPQPYRTSPDWAYPGAARRAAARPRAFRPLELGAALAIAIVVDVALWHQGLAGGGFGLAVAFALLPAVILATARMTSRVHRITPRLAIVTGLLGLVALRCVYEPSGTVVLCGLGLLGAVGLVLRRSTLSVPDVLLSALAGAIKLPSRIEACARGARKMFSRTKLGNVSVLPIAIPAALLVGFLGVFSLANPVVARGVEVCFKTIASVVALPSIGRIVFFVVALGLATALVRPALWFSKGAEAAKTEADATPTALLVARNALACLNVMFLGYNALDARYLWTGAPPAGIRTQAYAHEGAFWLTIALLMLTAVIGVMFKGPLAHDARAQKTRWLAYAWMAQGVVLGFGTYRRIAIHIANSGLSDLRIVGILGTTLVLSGVVLVAVKLQRARTFTWLVRRQLDAFALTVIVYALTPTHYLGAEVNVARVEHGEYRPLLHAFAQSHHAESATSLLPLLHHPDVRVRQGVAALLLDERAILRMRRVADGSWREKDVASGRALATLDEHAAELAQAIGTVHEDDARRVLLEISRVANEDRSLEELLAIPAATSDTTQNESGTRARSVD